MTQTISLAVTGMKCGGCETIIKDKLSSLAGVVSVTASSKDKLVAVEFDVNSIDQDSIEEAITASGFTVVND